MNLQPPGFRLSPDIIVESAEPPTLVEGAYIELQRALETEDREEVVSTAGKLLIYLELAHNPPRGRTEQAQQMFDEFVARTKQPA